METRETKHFSPAPGDAAGGRGGVLTDPDHVRSDCVTIAKLLKMGVFTEDQTREMVAAAYPLALSAKSAGKGREYAAVMKVVLESAKLVMAADPDTLLAGSDPATMSDLEIESEVAELNRRLEGESY